jgi:hypothetical protein
MSYDQLAISKMSYHFFKAKMDNTKINGDLELKLPWRIYEDSK